MLARPTTIRRPALRRRAAYTLLEMIAVVTLIGVLAGVAVARLGPLAAKDFASDGDARRLAFDLAQTKRRAIATGDNHYVEFALDGGGQATGYAIYRRLSGGGAALVEPPREFPQEETVDVSHAIAEFTFEGAALAGYTVTFTGPNRAFRVSVAAATGAVTTVEL